jgi:hypothetical protein
VNFFRYAFDLIGQPDRAWRPEVPSMLVEVFATAATARSNRSLLHHAILVSGLFYFYRCVS